MGERRNVKGVADAITILRGFARDLAVGLDPVPPAVDVAAEDQCIATLGAREGVLQMAIDFVGRVGGGPDDVIGAARAFETYLVGRAVNWVCEPPRGTGDRSPEAAGAAAEHRPSTSAGRT